jgi:branched-chain amino acid aminotransferase
MSVHVPQIERVAASRRAAVDFATTAFGTVMSDHMLVAEYADGAWRDVAIRPYGPLALLPSISGLNYAVSVLEGLKAHRGPGGEVLLFRPRDNARRMIRSAERLAMASVPEPLFLDWIDRLLEVDQAWVPDASVGALYVRPLLFSTDPVVRPQPASRFTFVIYSAPYAAYYPAPLDVHVVERYVRAFPGGTGDVKPGGNYAQALIGDREAAAAGCQTALWLDAVHREYIEECGVMNAFFALGDTVVTPELGGTILAGIQRDSVIALLRDRGLRVDERRISIHELVAAHQRGELREAFGTGTAATVSHVRSLRYRDHHLVLPAVEQRTIGPAVRSDLLAIATGRAPDPRGWVTRVGSRAGGSRS